MIEECATITSGVARREAEMPAGVVALVSGIVVAGVAMAVAATRALRRDRRR